MYLLHQKWYQIQDSKNSLKFMCLKFSIGQRLLSSKTWENVNRQYTYEKSLGFTCFQGDAKLKDKIQIFTKHEEIE